MKNILRLILPVILISSIVSCRSTKKLQTAISKKDTPVIIHTIPASKDSMQLAETVLNKLQHSRIDFKTFSAKIKVEYEDSKERKPDFNANIRIQSDSIIWISITATFLGIEAFRVLITKDSIIILNKLDKEYERHPFSYIQEIAKIPLDFKTLQDLIVGNPIYVGDKVVAYRETENHILLSTVGTYFKNLITLSSDNKNIERSKLDDIDVSQNRTADLTYAEYETKAGFPFSTYREITVAEKTKVDIKLNYKQYDFNNQLSYPWSIPKNYKRK